MTGAELVTRLRAACAARGVPHTASGYNAYRLAEIARADRPGPRTVARIEAFIAGAPLPSLRGYQFATNFSREGPGPVAGPADGVNREPCFHCGTRGDLGCKHRRAEDVVEVR